MLLLCIASGAGAVMSNDIPTREPDWSKPDDVVDLAMSADGSIVAAATWDDMLMIYDGFGNILWSWGQENFSVTSVDVSDDGNAVAAAIHNKTAASPTYEDYLLFWKNAKNLIGNPDPDWRSINLWGQISKDALAISGNGNEVVVVGTGPNVYYWNNTLALSGSDVNTTWDDWLSYMLEHVDISYGGDVVAIMGFDYSYSTGAWLYKNCKSRTGHASTNDPDLTRIINNYPPGGIAISDTGTYVAAGVNNTVYFFNTSGSGAWDYQWMCQFGTSDWVEDVDISGDGGTVVAVINGIEESPKSLAIFLGSQSKTDPVSGPDKEFTEASDYTIHNYYDVCVDYLGTIAVAGTGDFVFAVNASTGLPIWRYNGTYPSVSLFVDISDDGLYVVSAGMRDSIHYFGKQPEPPIPVGGIVPPALIPFALNTLILSILSMVVLSTLLILARRKSYT